MCYYTIYIRVKNKNVIYNVYKEKEEAIKIFDLVKKSGKYMYCLKEYKTNLNGEIECNEISNCNEMESNKIN